MSDSVAAVRIVRGRPDDVELAALTVALAALAAGSVGSTEDKRPRPANWERPARYSSPGARTRVW